VPLSFENIAVNDDTYGTQGENLDQGERFWGVWIANSTTNVAPTDPDKWFPVQVTTPGPSFTINWSLFGGLTPQQQQGDQDYYVFVKFLDGAGNPTTATIQARKIHLEANPDRPSLYLPTIHK
jgi:hypothetical protein